MEVEATEAAVPSVKARVMTPSAVLTMWYVLILIPILNKCFPLNSTDASNNSFV